MLTASHPALPILPIFHLFFDREVTSDETLSDNLNLHAYSIMSPTTLSRTHTHTPTPFTPYSSRRPSAASHVSKASSHRSIRCNGNNNDDASSVCSFASTMTAAQDEPEWIGAPLLPNEVIDLVCFHFPVLMCQHIQ